MRSDREDDDRKAIGDLYRQSREKAEHESAIRSLRFTINVLIREEEMHRKKLKDLAIVIGKKGGMKRP